MDDYDHKLLIRIESQAKWAWLAVTMLPAGLLIWFAIAMPNGTWLDWLGIGMQSGLVALDLGQAMRHHREQCRLECALVTQLLVDRNEHTGQSESEDDGED